MPTTFCSRPPPPTHTYPIPQMPTTHAMAAVQSCPFEWQGAGRLTCQPSGHETCHNRCHPIGPLRVWGGLPLLVLQQSDVVRQHHRPVASATPALHLVTVKQPSVVLAVMATVLHHRHCDEMLGQPSKRSGAQVPAQPYMLEILQHDFTVNSRAPWRLRPAPRGPTRPFEAMTKEGHE